MQNTILATLAHNLEAHGWATQFQNPGTLEIYGINLAEHYLLTLRKSSHSGFDILYIPSLGKHTSRKASQEHAT